MNTTSGIIVINEENKVLLCHPTGVSQDIFNLPKGLVEEGEHVSDTAIRETEEETGLIIDKKDLFELGLFPYVKEKDIHLFLTKKHIVLSKLVCKSCFINKNGVETPEMDGYILVSIAELYDFISPKLKNTFQKYNIVEKIENYLK